MAPAAGRERRSGRSCVGQGRGTLGGRESGLGEVEAGLGLVEGRLGNGLVRTKIGLAFEVLLSEREIRLGGLDVGLRLGEIDGEGLAVDLDERSALGDLIADLDEYPVDPAADLRRHGHGVEGADFSDQLDRRVFLPDLGGDELDLARRQRTLERLGGVFDAFNGGVVISLAAGAESENEDGDGEGGDETEAFGFHGCHSSVLASKSA